MALMRFEEAQAAFVAGKADLLIFLAHPSEAEARSLIAAARRAAGKRFALLVPPAAKGLAHQLRQFETSAIPAGIFGGNPPLPAEDAESVAITYDLVATTGMSERRGGFADESVI